MTVRTLTLPGAPRTKKNHGRIWRAGTRTVIRPSEPWLAWRDAAWRYVHQNGLACRRWALATPHNCAAHFYRDRDAGDAVGYYQGLADVLEEIGVLVDDKWLTQWDGSRLYMDRAQPRVELTLTPITTRSV